MRRRLQLLLTGLLVGLLTVLAPAPVQAAADCTAPAVERFGPASLTGAIVGATVYDGRAYVVTRGLKPPVLAEIDLATRTVVRQTPLPDGPATGEPEGAWATTVSGGKVYLGTYPVPDLYRFDPATGELTRLASYGVNGGYIWSLTTAPDGTVYAGTYPDGRVWEYDPDTGASRRLGVLASGERYVRSIAADGSWVYAGLLDKAKLVAVHRTTGAVRELAAGGSGFGTLALGKTRIRAASGNTLYDMKTDGTDLRTVTLGAGSVDAIGLAPDGTAYLSTRPDGTVYRYRTGEPLLELGTPRLGEETRRLVVGGTGTGQTLTGFSGSGGYWTMDLADAGSDYTDLIDAGLTPGSERPQSILLDAEQGSVWVAGHYSVTVRGTDGTTKRRVWVPGEPKAMTRRGDKVYAAIYPSGQIIELDRTTYEMRSLGYLGHDQQRPWDLEYDPATDKLLVATAPLGAKLDGALSVVDPDTGDKQVYAGVIPGQAIMTLTRDGSGLVYLGGDVRGGGGTPPTQATASVAAFDLATRTVRWRTDPVHDYDTFQDLKYHDGLLYGVYKRNASWFAMDPATRQLVHQGTLPGYGEIEVHQGAVFTSTYFGGGNVHQLGPGLPEAKLIASGLGDEWYTNPQLAFEPDGWRAWALAGRDLARLRLDPACEPVVIGPMSST